MKSPRPWLVAVTLACVALTIWFRSEPDRELARAWKMQGPLGLDAVAFTPDSQHLAGLVKEQGVRGEVWDTDSGRSHAERFPDILVGPLLDPIARPQAVFSASSGRVLKPKATSSWDVASQEIKSIGIKVNSVGRMTTVGSRLNCWANRAEATPTASLARSMPF